MPRRRRAASLIGALLLSPSTSFLHPTAPRKGANGAQRTRSTLPPSTRPTAQRSRVVTFGKKRRKEIVIQEDWYSDEPPYPTLRGGGSGGGGGGGGSGNGNGNGSGAKLSGASPDLDDYYEPYRRSPSVQEEAELDQVLNSEFRNALVKPPAPSVLTGSGSRSQRSDAPAAAAAARSPSAGSFANGDGDVTSANGGGLAFDGAEPLYWLEEEDDDDEDGDGSGGLAVVNGATSGRLFSREVTENGIIYYTPNGDGEEDEAVPRGVASADDDAEEEDGVAAFSVSVSRSVSVSEERFSEAEVEVEVEEEEEVEVEVREEAATWEDDDIVMVDDGTEDGVQVFEVGGDEPLTDVSHLTMHSDILADFIASGETIDAAPASHTFQTAMVVAVDPIFERALVGNFQNFGVQVKANFADFEPVGPDVGWTLEEMAAYKCRAVFEATGGALPVVAEATSFEVEAVHGGVGRKNARYRFNHIGPHVDKLVQALAPVSDPRRICSFRTVLCYYDGQQELFEGAEADVAMVYASSHKALITAASATLDMCEVLHSMSPELEFLPQVMRSPSETKQRATVSGFAGASMLHDTMLKLGRVLPNNIIDVSSFMESMVDTALMQECAKELADRFAKIKPSKILTVATTGLIIATPMAMILQVPVVYARKQRSIVMSDYYIASYSSKTQGTNRELVVSKAHLSPEDRVLIVDDFLSAGSCQDALLRILSDAGATPVGIGVLVEKAYEAGRQFLSGYNLPIESLAKVISVESGQINLGD